MGENAYPERSSIPFKPRVQVFEPKQRALIAFNGNEEILIVSADVYASEPVKVLEVTPFPSEPTVKKVDRGIFKRAAHLIDKKIAQQYRARILSGSVKGEREKAPRVGEVTFHEQIGVHDILVIRVLSREGFIEWVTRYLRDAGEQNPVIPEVLKKIVGEYIEKRFDWFVFDTVSLDPEPKTRETIQYRFRTDFLFYPLKTSLTDKGTTTVELCIVSPQIFNEFPGISVDRIALTHPPVSFTLRETTGLMNELNGFFGRNGDIKLRIWKIQGRVSSLRDDVIAVSYETDTIRDVKDKRVLKQEDEKTGNNLDTVELEEETPLVKFKDE